MKIKKFIVKSLNFFLSNPPWLIGLQGKRFKRLKGKIFILVILELLKKILILIIRFFRYFSIDRSIITKIPFETQLKGYFLNSFGARELLYLNNLGISSWEYLAHFTPANLTQEIHNDRRKNNKNYYMEAISILNNKNKLLNIIDKKWRTPSFLINDSNLYDDNLSKANFLNNFLRNDGIIFKPNFGSQSKKIINYRMFGRDLKFRFINPTSDMLFKHINYQKETVTYMDLYSHWKSIFKTQEEALMQPFLNHKFNFPLAKQPIVLRVISAFEERLSKKNKYYIRQAWLEINIDIGKMLFIGIKSKGIFFPEYFFINNSYENNLVKLFVSQIRDETDNSIDLALKTSIKMHKKLPLLDQVAWDWIVTNDQPKLLEGNHNFGLKNIYIFEAKEKLEKI